MIAPGTRTVKPNATGRMPLKNTIEVENGGSTGWTVHLMSLNQATIHQEAFAFARL
jgi:hypothetical protein